MHYDDAAKALVFESQKEVILFHAQVTSVVRDAICAAGQGIADAKEAARRADKFFAAHAVLMKAINELRARLPRTTR